MSNLTLTVEPVFPPLTAQDRCDACSAAAQVRLWKLAADRVTNRDLLMCGHHHDQHVVQLGFDGWSTFEDRRRVPQA